jgi:phosphoglycerate dehydrogenase-like enzyme
MKMLHMAAGKAHPRVWTQIFCRALAELGELEIVEDAAAMSRDAVLARLREADVLLGAWDCLKLPDALAGEPGRVRYLCCITGGVRAFVSDAHIDSQLPVTNWGDAPANDIAEGAVCLLLAALKGLHARILSVRAGGGAGSPMRAGGTLRGLNLGIYGFGVIGRRFAELMRPFGCVMRVFDPFVDDLPDYVAPVASLEELFSGSEAVAIHAGLNQSTRGAVTARLLALLPRHGIVINTARGDIIDQEALFRELESGRLRAGLDVLAEPERLPAEHPARGWENLIWTCHDIARGWPEDGEPPRTLAAMHEVCLDNLRRFRAGQPLRFMVDRRRFDLST